MRLAISLAIVAFLLSACATTNLETEFHLGVDAYMAEDFTLARKHWSKPAAAGVPIAQNNLAHLLYSGLGGERDLARAVSLWKEAAERGYSEAQWHLAHCIEDGLLGEPDPVEAYAWYRTAIANAESALEPDRNLQLQIAAEARKGLAKLTKRLTPQQVGVAELRAKQLMRKYLPTKPEA